jgi:hypothetical protein
MVFLMWLILGFSGVMTCGVVCSRLIRHYRERFVAMGWENDRPLSWGGQLMTREFAGIERCPDSIRLTGWPFYPTGAGRVERPPETLRRVA